MAINCVGRKFENILLTSLKESLALFPVNELKVEKRLIIEKIVARRDDFGQLPTGYGFPLGMVYWERGWLRPRNLETQQSPVDHYLGICVSGKLGQENHMEAHA